MVGRLVPLLYLGYRALLRTIANRKSTAATPLLCRLASDCLEWSDHCHATDTGAMKHSWKALRERAKALLQAGKRPPVSGRYVRIAKRHYCFTRFWLHMRSLRPLVVVVAHVVPCAALLCER